MKVYVVLFGEQYEGVSIAKIFRQKKDAFAYAGITVREIIDNFDGELTTSIGGCGVIEIKEMEVE